MQKCKKNRVKGDRAVNSSTGTVLTDDFTGSHITCTCSSWWCYPCMHDMTHMYVHNSNYMYMCCHH